MSCTVHSCSAHVHSLSRACGAGECLERHIIKADDTKFRICMIRNVMERVYHELRRGYLNVAGREETELVKFAAEARKREDAGPNRQKRPKKKANKPYTSVA